MMDFNSRRTLQDVKDILNLAKLTENDILLTSQALFFTPINQNKNNFRLLELNSDLLNALESNQEVCIKGDDDDDIVICTATSTFHVNVAETSNSLLLMKSLNYFGNIPNVTENTIKPVKLFGVFQEYLEVNLGIPHIKRLSDLLIHALYKGPEFEYVVQNTKLYSLSELRNIVQASDLELSRAIESMDVVEIDGKVRQLDFEYHFRVLSLMLKLIDENSWDLHHIDFEETCRALRDFVPLKVIKIVFKKYANESEIMGGLQLYQYKEEEVCGFFARVLLREAGKFNLDDFLQAWRGSVPEGMVPTEEMLHGIAIINRKSNPNVIRALEENTLPDDIHDRFRILFDAHEKWTVPEITPYIRRLATKQLDVNALLAKHARSSKMDGVTYYSAKHAK